jgi:hypothetical protein
VPLKSDIGPVDEEPTLLVQALIVTHGPFAGRICENDDDDFVSKSDLRAKELKWMEEAGVIWRRLDAEDADDGESELSPDVYIGVDCEIVTFGFYLNCREHYYIPRQFLRPATTRDLVQRYQEIEEIIFSDALLEEKRRTNKELVDLLKEESYIMNELWRREKAAQDVVEPRNVFLCHASADKPFIRQVWSDLANLGHKPWLDEYEIRVGDSIVQKINEGTKEAGALVLFLSKASAESAWVQREWSSALARQLSARNIQILPALIEDCEIPSIIADVKYADFRESYNHGLAALMSGLR